MAGIPFAPDQAAGLPLVVLTQAVASTASPATATFTVPKNAIYLCTVRAWVNSDAQNQAVATFILTYFRGSSNVLSRNVIGGPTISSPSSKSIGSLTVNVPTTAGTFTVVAAWTDGIAAPVLFECRMYQLTGLDSTPA